MHSGNGSKEDVRRSLKTSQNSFEKTTGCFCSKHAFGLPLLGFESSLSVNFCLFGQSTGVDFSPLNSDNSCSVMSALSAFSHSFSCLKHLSSIF